MARRKGVLNDLVDANLGNRIKQGDKTTLRYLLKDANGTKLGLDGKPAVAHLRSKNKVAQEGKSDYIVYKQDITIGNNTLGENTAEFNVDVILPATTYLVEIEVEGGSAGIYPSDHDLTLQIYESTPALEVNEFAGVGNEYIERLKRIEEVLEL